MTPPQITLIKNSWRLVAPSAAVVGPVFYANLFAIDPSLRPLFPADITAQAHKLMAALSLLVDQLENSETVVRELTGLARRHVRYGVRPEHYAPVGQALLQTLQEGLAHHWTSDVQTAWATLFQTVSSAMIALADTPDPTRPAPL